jgi:branched-chain amino acid transport system permease protein
MPSWSEFQPYIVTGLALGGIYALSGVGLVVLYRATGVLNLAFGAVGAMGAFIAYSMIQAGDPDWLAWIVCILFGGVVTLGYGLVFGPALAGRGPLVQAVSTLGLALVIFGVIDLAWPTTGGEAPSISFPTDSTTVFSVSNLSVSWTQLIALGLGVVITIGTWAFLRFSKLGTAMRAMANDREITATLGVPVRRVEAAAWLGCGLVAGIAGIMLADLSALDDTTLVFTVVISSLAAALIARLRSIIGAFVAALVIGLVHDMLTPFTVISNDNYNDLTPFVLAAIALLVMSRGQVLTRSREEG